MAGQVVVIMGSPDDPCVSRTRQALLQRGSAVVSFEVADLLKTVGLHWSVEPTDDESFLVVDSLRIPLTAVSGVLVRSSRPPVPDPRPASEERDYIAGELQATLFAFLQALDCRVINRPPRGVMNRVAIATVETAGPIREAGFRLPRVLATADCAAVAEFWDACGRRVLLRHPSGWRPWVFLPSAEAVVELTPLLSQQPLFLQELPAGQWLRVFVVGDRVFGVTGDITLPHDQEGPDPWLPIELAGDLQQRCLRLTRQLHLEFAQIDAIETPGCERYCLDVSDSPDFERCGPELQRALAAALADRLVGERESVPDDPGVRHSRRQRDGVPLLSPAIAAD